MKYAAIGFLVIGFVVTLWIWAFLEGIQWVPLPGAGSGREAGLAISFSLAFFRWFALSAAFVFLLLNGTLSGWSRFAVLRILLAFAGITMMEICMFPVNIRSVDESVSPHLRLFFKFLVILLPLCVMVGGLLGSRILFAIGTAGALCAAVWHLPAYTAPPPDTTTIEYMLINLDTQLDRQEILARLERHPGWVRKVSRALIDTNLNAAVMLSTKPDALDENLQERCWKVVLFQLALVKPIRDRGENWMPGEIRGIALAVQGLVSIRGPVRDRHRADFVVIRDLVDFYRNQTPETRHPELPDLRQSDWLSQ